jgi:hypothetical protein
MPKRLHPTDRTITVHVRIPETMHAEFVQAKGVDGRPMSKILREMARGWIDETLARQARDAAKIEGSAR